MSLYFLLLSFTTGTNWTFVGDGHIEMSNTFTEAVYCKYLRTESSYIDQFSVVFLNNWYVIIKRVCKKLDQVFSSLLRIILYLILAVTLETIRAVRSLFSALVAPDQARGQLGKSGCPTGKQRHRESKPFVPFHSRGGSTFKPISNFWKIPT